MICLLVCLGQEVALAVMVRDLLGPVAVWEVEDLAAVLEEGTEEG